MVHCMASLARAAANGAMQWEQFWQSLCTVQVGLPWSKHWCAPSFVAVLRAAADCVTVKAIMVSSGIFS